MGDFYQNGVITTLQELGKRDYERYESELGAFARERPLALVMPTLYSDLKGPAIGKIIDELSRVEYLSWVIVSLGGATQDQYRHARDLLCTLPQRVSVIWNDGERMEALKERIHDQNLYLGEPGKGIGAWMAYGLVLSDPSIRAVAMHDCDIINYNRIVLHRLAYPVLNPMLDYEFCKGFYARVSDRLYGRVTRLFVTPVLRALERVLGRTPFLTYLRSFRYPLAGEFCLDADVARVNKVPANWGLEIGTITEIFRNTSPRRICQVDLGLDYEHRHQMSGFTDPRKGLLRMARETSLSLFHTLAADGANLSESFFRSLRAAYSACANDAIRQYADLSAVNGLVYDRYGEEQFVDYFTKTLERAGAEFLSDPIGLPDLPNWNQVQAALPEVFELLRLAVEEDAQRG